MLAFATDGITSFSIKPIRMITTCGFLIFAISILMLLYFLVVHFMGRTVHGWTSTIVSIWAIGGLQLLAIGIVGEYIGKIYLCLLYTSDLLAARMICGAGGVGFLQAILKKGCTKEQLRERIHSVFQDSGVDVWDCALV